MYVARRNKRRTYRSNLPPPIRNHSHNRGPKHTAALIRNRIKCIKLRFIPPWNQFSKQTSTIRAQSAQYESIHRAQWVHFPLLLQPQEAQALHGGDVAEQAVNGYEFEQEDTAEDGLHGGEVQKGGHAGPGECAEDAGEGGYDVYEREHSVGHAEGSFGEEDGCARDSGDAV